MNEELSSMSGKGSLFDRFNSALLCYGPMLGSITMGMSKVTGVLKRASEEYAHLTDVYAEVRKYTGITEEDSDRSRLKEAFPGARSRYRDMVVWGDSNNFPSEVIQKIRQDEVMSQNQLFNQLSAYGAGLSFRDKEGNPLEEDSPVYNFLMHNRPVPFWLDQISDMKYWFSSLSVILLSRDRDIVRLVHKDMSYCRFETAHPETGKIEHIFFADWARSPKEEEVEVIPLLDPQSPLLDLEIRLGLSPNSQGKRKDSGERKFAILNRFPTVGNVYYRFAPFWGFFLSGWYDVKHLIPEGKKSRFSKGLAVRYIVEISDKYWDKIFKSEGIHHLEAQKERKRRELSDIRQFLTGLEHAGSTWVTGSYTNLQTGKEEPLVRITSVPSQGEGGDWLEDVEEASNMACYAQGVHPDLIGAVPGKSRSGVSTGGDKKELFRMKQTLEFPYQDLLLETYRIIRDYMRRFGSDEKIRTAWRDLRISVPMNDRSIDPSL